MKLEKLVAQPNATIYIYIIICCNCNFGLNFSTHTHRNQEIQYMSYKEERKQEFIEQSKK